MIKKLFNEVANVIITPLQYKIDYSSSPACPGDMAAEITLKLFTTDGVECCISSAATRFMP